jgi:hypothetical protein
MVGYNLGAALAYRISAQKASTATVTHWPQAPYPPILPLSYTQKHLVLFRSVWND